MINIMYIVMVASKLATLTSFLPSKLEITTTFTPYGLTTIFYELCDSNEMI